MSASRIRSWFKKEANVLVIFVYSDKINYKYALLSVSEELCKNRSVKGKISYWQPDN